MDGNESNFRPFKQRFSKRYLVLQFIDGYPESGDESDDLEPIDTIDFTFTDATNVADYTRSDDGEAIIFDSLSRKFRYKGEWHHAKCRDNEHWERN